MPDPANTTHLDLGPVYRSAWTRVHFQMKQGLAGVPEVCGKGKRATPYLTGVGRLQVLIWGLDCPQAPSTLFPLLGLDPMYMEAQPGQVQGGLLRLAHIPPVGVYEPPASPQG